MLIFKFIFKAEKDHFLYPLLFNFNIIKKYFQLSQINFNEYFFSELKRKIDNMLHYTILRIKKQENNFASSLFSIFNSKQISAEDIADYYFSLDLNLVKLYPNSPKDFDKKIIFKSLKSKWFKCQNDHLYTSEEVPDTKTENDCPYCTLSQKALIWMKKKLNTIF